ncbi:MAG: hypothetical protein AAGD96_27525 [Chloroflexota bacterium]
MQAFILKNINRFINSADAKAGAKTVETIKTDNPAATPEELVDLLIKRKCRQAGSVGAVTSGAAIIPGLGTVAAMTFGVAADIGMTFKLQAELVLEIAAAYDRELTEAEKQKIILSITGISAGSQAALQKAGQHVATKATAQLAQKSLAKAIPFLGVAASGGTNIVTTYIIGRRAQAYFSLGPENMEDWKDGLRAISGVDEQEIIRWLGESTESSWQMLSNGTRAAKDSVVVTSQNTGTAVIVYSKKAADSIKSSGSWLYTTVSGGVARIWPFSTDGEAEAQEQADSEQEAESMFERVTSLLPWRKEEELQEIDTSQLIEQFVEAEISNQHVIGVVGASDSIHEPRNDNSSSYLSSVTNLFSWRPESWWKSDGSEKDPELMSEIFEAEMPVELIDFDEAAPDVDDESAGYFWGLFGRKSD